MGRKSLMLVMKRRLRLIMPRSASHPGIRGVRLSMRVASEEDGRRLSPRSHLRPLGGRNTTLLKATIRHIQGPQNE